VRIFTNTGERIMFTYSGAELRSYNDGSKLVKGIQLLSRMPVTILAVLLQRDIQCKVPMDITFSHGAIGIVITKNAKIGSCVVVGQNVTIGKKHYDDVPIIEDYVVILPHAIVFGDVTIGHHSIIGAGAVVNKSVPPYSLVVGNPFRILKEIKSVNEYWDYRGKKSKGW